MKKSAEYTIKGFLYQFNKTLLELLTASDEAEVTIEGIVEDIDIRENGLTCGIQCKYHETQDSFSMSQLYKPILQMMQHFNDNPSLNIQYILYCYFPDKTGSYSLSQEELHQILNTQNKKLIKYTEGLNSFNETTFLKKIRIEFGVPFKNIEDSVLEKLKENGLPDSDVETLSYPNAIQFVANHSIKVTPQERTVKKSTLLNFLHEIRKTTISKWTLHLKSKKKIMLEKKNELKNNLKNNSRKRYFLINPDSIEDFNSNIINFIDSYIKKYHFKIAHTETPIFFIDCDETSFQSFLPRLYKKGIKYIDGFRGQDFFLELFFKEPILRCKSNKIEEREFDIRIFRFSGDHRDSVINYKKCDDLFLISHIEYNEIDIQDINLENLDIATLKELEYLLGVSEVYE